MLENFIKNKIIHALPFVPNEGQQALLEHLSDFLACRDERKAFVLKGYAGTGKTSIMAALVKALSELQQRVVLLAPTGRAAKVLARYATQSAYTIHKYIYRQNKLGVDAFSLTDNKHKNTLFIVDEASMISGKRDNPTFGSGMLLDDLVKFVYSGEGCSMLLLGDDAQLSPIGSDISPALDIDYLSGYGLSVQNYTLKQVARQAMDSGVLLNATYLRQVVEDTTNRFEYQWLPDFQQIDGNDFVEKLETAYSEVGMEDTIILTRSNKRTNLYNQGVRARLLWREESISAGDRVMISKNNYFWTKAYENLSFLANGDMMEIVRLRNWREMYGFHFADAALRAIDYDWEIDTMLWLDTLTSDSPEANYVLQQQLFERMAEDYPELAHNRRKLVETIYETPYFNALQVRFAYAVTCHKAQGGQWKRVFVDTGLVPVENRDKNYYRWLYTAITRATEQVYLLKNE